MKIFTLFTCAVLAAPFAFAQGEPPGTIKATTKIRRDGTRETTILNPDTRTAEETLADTTGKVLRKKVFPLNDRNFATGVTHYDAKGKARYKEVYTRDGADRIVESQLFTPDDKPLGKRVFHYDAKGTARIDDYDAAGALLAKPVPATTSRGRPDKKKR